MALVIRDIQIFMRLIILYHILYVMLRKILGYLTHNKFENILHLTVNEWNWSKPSEFIKSEFIPRAYIQIITHTQQIMIFPVCPPGLVNCIHKVLLTKRTKRTRLLLT